MNSRAMGGGCPLFMASGLGPEFRLLYVVFPASEIGSILESFVGCARATEIHLPI
jgi:hypothetical protein